MSLAEVRARLNRATVVLDYDGTLAAIVADPAAAEPSPGAVEVLRGLVPRVDKVAIVTGRPSRFVRDRLPVDGLEVVGLYGLEGAPGLGDEVRRAVAAVTAAEPGVTLEDKGISLAVHTRRAADPEGAEHRLRSPLAAIAREADLVVRGGKRVLELSPPGAGKAAVARSLVEGAGAVLIAGDDLADAEAFSALSDLPASGVALVRVGVVGLEVPEELRAVADLVVDGPEGLLDLLRTL